MNQPTVVSLFSGAGGADLGFEQAGLEVIYSCDVDPICKETYDNNFDCVQRPYSVQFILERMKSRMTLRQSVSDVLPDSDVIIGGPPCQSFSMIRVRNKLSCSGLENVYAMQEIVKIKRPKVFVCENVASILKQDGMIPVFLEFKNGFVKDGYHVDAYIFNTADYGIPQHRERAFFIGIRNDLYFSGARFCKPSGTPWSNLYGGWADYLDVDRQAWYVARASNVKGRPGNMTTFTLTGAEWPVIRYSYGDMKMRGNQVNSISHLAMNVEQRYLTKGELKKLQGFPEDFKFSGNMTEIRRQIGNAWSVPVGKAIGQEIRRLLNDDTKG